MTPGQRRRTLTAVASLLVGSFLGAGIATGCGPWLTFRAYLRRSFWQPVRHFSASLAASAPKGGRPVSYAGFSDDAVPSPLGGLRMAYRDVADDFGRAEYGARVEAAARAAAAALAPGALGGAALEEARLLDAKVAMRAVLDAGVGDVAETRRKLESFLASKPSAANASEARCWLARVLRKQGDAVGAVRIYLEELDRPSPVVPAETLAASVRMAFVANQQQFWDRADEFFDNPRHALFIVNVLTNPPFHLDEPRPNRSRNTGKILALLRAKTALFHTGADSDALAMALMRVSLFAGDVDGVLRDSQAVAPASPVRKAAEFNWMVASAHYLRGDYAKAEEPLQRMLDAPGATVSDRRTGAQALLAVYLKLQRRVDALHAALLGASTGDDSSLPVFEADLTRPQWCVSCDTLDLPYLLDAVLTKAELSAYLAKYPGGVGVPIEVQGGRKISAPDLVEYSLAVRHARDGHYAEAARIYEKLGAEARATRVRTLAAIAARAGKTTLPAAQRLQARYDLAAYLADNPDRILFNDLLWRGFQRMALTGAEWDPRSERESGLTAAERQDVLTGDRRLRDEQEERWQAFLRLEPVVRDAGHSPLARTAALKILDTLARINTDRFGRQDEIAAAITKWRQWLRQGDPLPPAGGQLGRP